ncbi:MAG: Transcription factor iws1 [Watsoniomyces obsoletus]|nr:MAG: Transcription factor iws1 [Watsoniomyces obsoletus]
MDDPNGSSTTAQGSSGDVDININIKGKGKAVMDQSTKDTVMTGDTNEEELDEEEEEEESDEGDDEHVAETVEEDEEDMKEITTDNILPTGRRTRGLEINYAKAAQEAGDELAEDEEDDEDFHAEGTGVDDDDAMQE